jgi:hypothetical protein
MDAFLTIVGPGTGFPEMPRAIVSIKLQMRLQAKFFSQQIWLKLIKALLSEAQFNPELAEAFRERWILPRRLLICCTPRSTIACRLGLGPSTKSIQTEFLSR